MLSMQPVRPEDQPDCEHLIDAPILLDNETEVAYVCFSDTLTVTEDETGLIWLCNLCGHVSCDFGLDAYWQEYEPAFESYKKHYEARH